MKRLLLPVLLLISPIVSANMDDLCFVYIKEFGKNDILNALEGQGCVRNNVLQVVYGMDNASETIMMFHSSRGSLALPRFVKSTWKSGLIIVGQTM